MKITVRIRFTNSVGSAPPIPDLDIPLLFIPEREDINHIVSTQWIKSTIRNKVEACRKHRVRLIYNGRVLNDTTNYKTEVFDPLLRNPEWLHILYIHCVVGDELTPQQLAEEAQLDNQGTQVTTAPQVIGFDRLLNQGFSPADVEDLRQQFRMLHDVDTGPSSSEGITDVEAEEQRNHAIRQLEEQWIELTVMPSGDGPTRPQYTATGSFSGAGAGEGPQPRPAADLDDVHGDYDLVFGLLIGVFLGVLAILFLLVDDSVFTKRQQMSIILGVCFNVLVAITHGVFR